MEHYIVDVMSTNPVLIDERSHVSTALSWATSHRVHYLVVICNEGGLGVVCLCDLEHTRARSRVSACMHSPAVTVDTQQPVAKAVVLMECHGIGCLPVVDWLSDLLQGVVTRHDLRAYAPQSAFLHRRCAGCGASHGLTALQDLQLDFCRACMANATEPCSTEGDLYFTPGGGN